MFNKKRNLILILLVCFSLCFVSASLENLGTFKQGETVRISQVCSDATYINISSISYPNSTVAVSNIEMTSSGSGEYYYDFSLTDTAGRYDVRGVSDGCEMTFATYLEIKNANLIFIILILLLASLFFISTLFVNEEFLVYISGVLFLVAGIYIMINGIDIMNDWYSRTIAYVTIGIGLLFTLGAYIYNSYSKWKEDEY